MNTFTAKPFKSGNSVVVTIPRYLIKEGYIDDRHFYEFTFRKEGKTWSIKKRAYS